MVSHVWAFEKEIYKFKDFAMSQIFENYSQQKSIIITYYDVIEEMKDGNYAITTIVKQNMNASV